MKPLLANADRRPPPRSPAENGPDLLARETALFDAALPPGSAAAINAKVGFPVSGTSDAQPGVIVMRIDDTIGADLDPALRGVVVVFNATMTPPNCDVIAGEWRDRSRPLAHPDGRLRSVVKPASRASAMGNGPPCPPGPGRVRPALTGSPRAAQDSHVPTRPGRGVKGRDGGQESPRRTAPGHSPWPSAIDHTGTYPPVASATRLEFPIRPEGRSTDNRIVTGFWGCRAS